MIIALTCFNRVSTLKKTVESLMKCKDIESVPIYYYGDWIGGDWGVLGVEQYINEVKRPIDKHYYLESLHIGLKSNAYNAITDGLTHADEIIWLQDDMEFSEDFLRFMQFALHKYKKDPEIMFVSGYSPVTHHSLYLSPYLSEALGIWKHKYSYPDKISKDLSGFRKFAGDQAYNMLIDAEKGRDSISPYLYYSMYENNAYCLHPNRNKLRHLTTDSINSKAKDAKKFNQNLYEGFSERIDSGNLDLVKRYSPIKKFTRWLRR